MEFIKVTPSHAEFLYKLLMERPADANISHKQMPSFFQHVRFVHDHPYSEWYVIKQDGALIGSIYLTDRNEIGVAIDQVFQGLGYGKEAVVKLMCIHPGQEFFANINPKNKRSIDMFKSIGFEKCQVTMRMTL